MDGVLVRLVDLWCSCLHRRVYVGRHAALEPTPTVIVTSRPRRYFRVQCTVRARRGDFMAHISYSFVIEQPRRIVWTVVLTTVVAAVLRYAIGQILDLTLNLTEQQNAIADATTAGILAGAVMYLALRSARQRR